VNRKLLGAFVCLVACGAASSSRPVVTPAEASRRQACDETRQRWNIARVTSAPSIPRGPSTPEACKCGNGQIDTCTMHGRDCPGNNPHACDGIPVVERSFSDPCDGKDLGGLTCERLGFAGGALACTAACELDTSACEWLPPNAKSVPLSQRDVLVAMIANDDELLVITEPPQKTSPITARRYDRELRVTSETSVAGSLDGVAATPHGFVVAVRDDSGTPRKSAIYDLASPTPLFSFADGRVAMLWTVRGAERSLRDPIAILTQTTGTEELLRVRRGEHPVTTDARSSASWNAEAIETPSGIVLPASLFDPLLRVRSDGASEPIVLPEACPVHARYAPGWLAWLDGGMHASIVPVDDALRPRGSPSSFAETRLDAPVFVGDWLWFGGNDFARRDAGAAIVHLARGPVEPIMVTPFAGALAIVWNRGPSALTLVPFP
jgi:hypothetical protein